MKSIRILVVLGVLSLNGQEGGIELQRQLEESYKRWKLAVEQKDAKAWASAIPMFKQVEIRNKIISQRQAFPEAVFQFSMNPPKLEGLQLLEVQAKGVTAHLLYFGKIDFGDAPADNPANLLMLKFYYDNKAWRFDSNKVMNLDSMKEVREQLLKGGKPEFLDEPEFTPPGVMPPTPPLCAKPEYVTGATLQAFGYEVRLKANGMEHGWCRDRAEKFFVLGGLKRGKNELTLEVKPLEDFPKDAKRTLSLDLFVVEENQQVSNVFHYETDELGMTNGLVQKSFILSEEVIEQGKKR
jgi:hypothetical protein